VNAVSFNRCRPAIVRAFTLLAAKYPLVLKDDEVFAVDRLIATPRLPPA
jgi:hypothetical protein